MKLVSWNVNSIRARLDRLLAFLGREQPDVVCLQELKVSNDQFPHVELQAAGYQSAILGQKTYNGVAILARHEPEDVRLGLGDDTHDAESRIIAARVEGVRVISAYVPNGKVVGSDKWEYKLAFYDQLRRWLDTTWSPQEPLVLCGDFNVAPETRDVARPEEWEGTVLFAPEGREKLQTIVQWGFTDVVRKHHPEGNGPYTWWDYRMLGFPKGNGLRIDHILATAPLAARSTEARVDREERKGKLPSDHAPVIAVFAPQ